MIREEIAGGVFYTSFDGGYKKNRLSVHLTAPLERGNLTATALLPFLLERGCKEYPDMTALRRRLDMLYGASLYVSAFSSDYVRTLSFTLEGVDEKYLEPGIADLRLRLLLGVIFSPAAEDGAFRKDWVDIEREKLRVLILSEINDKRAYCLRKAAELYFENDARSLPGNGFAEDLDGIDGRSLFGVYNRFLKTANAEIIDGGGNGGIKERLKEAFSSVERTPAILPEKKAVPYAAPREGRLTLEVEQDKFAMIFTAGRLFTEREQSVLRLLNVILGASPTSRFFMNIREKQSLCYYCASRPGYISGSLTVDSGVEMKNAEKLRSAVLGEIEDISNGNVSGAEIAEAKLLLKNVLLGVSDSAESLSGWYLNGIYRTGRAVSPSEEIEAVETVTKEELSSLASLFKTGAVMLLCGEDADGIH